MRLKSRKNKGSKIIAWLVLGWLATLALSSSVQSSYKQTSVLNTTEKQQISFAQNAIVPLAESTTSWVSFSFQQTSSNDFSSQLNAALLGYNQLVKCNISRQHQLLRKTFIKYRKSDLLFPSHYFW